MRLRRVVIFFGGGFAALAILAVCSSAFFLPWLIDSHLIKQKINSQLAKRTGASVALGKIAVLWFPQPTVVVDHVEISFGATTHGSIRSVKIYPSILYLLKGHLFVRRAQLQEPRLSIHVPEGSGKGIGPELWQEQVHAALVRLIRESPAPHLDLSAGSAEIRIGDRPPVILRDVAAQTAGSRAEVRFELSGRSNLCDRLTVEGNISPESLQLRLEGGMQKVKIKELVALLALQISDVAPQGEASLDMKMTSTGLRQVKASITGSVRQLVLARQGRIATLEAKGFEGEITYEGGALQVAMKQLDLSTPRIQASGEFKIQSGLLSTHMHVRNGDIAEARDLMLRIADDAEDVKRIAAYIPAGKIVEMSFHSAGRSFAEMGSGKNINVSALIRDCKIFVPRLDLELNNVAGAVRISDGVLEANDVSVNLGVMKGWNGKLRLGLEGKPAPFHLDITAQAGAPELHSLLLRIVHDETFRGELLKLREVAGELSGRLVLGESLDAISPVVTISKADFNALYAPIPLPITVRGGRFGYDQKIVRIESAQGSVGRSSFAGLAAILDRDGRRHLRIDSKRVSLDLQQVDAFLRSFEHLQSHLAKFRFARGQIELEKVSVAGAYDDPPTWSFATAGTFDQAEITHADVPGPITFARGKFAANQERIDFSDCAIAISDASWVGGGTFEYGQEGAHRFAMTGMGSIGAQMSQWLSRQVELPEELNLRSPLKIAAARLTRRAGDEISLRARVIAAGGAQISLEAVKHPHGLVLRDLTIEDGSGHARIAFELAKENLDLSFRGKLTQQTIDKVFASFPAPVSAVAGDLQVSASLRRPVRVSARGQLAGSHLWIPLGTGKVLLEEFSMEAIGESVLVRSADLRWGASRVAVSGIVAGAQESLRLDLDVAADRFDWPEFERLFVSEYRQRQQKEGGDPAFPAVEGIVRFKADRFTFEDFDLTALETTAAISPAEFRTDIDRATMCGINVNGRVDVVGNETGIDLRLTAAGGELEPATVCLTNRKNDVTGTYSLTARVLGRGERDALLRALQGSFELTARDGEFISSPGIDATFDYLNTTGDFKIAFPDLDRQTFPYRLIAIKGRLDGEMLLADEIIVQSSLLNLSGQGRVDLAQRQIDAKGLIAVLKPIDEVVSRIPVIGPMLGGSLLGIPVRVTGSLERPKVTYLSPADVGAELLNIPLKILGLPIGAMRLFTPHGDSSDKDMMQ